MILIIDLNSEEMGFDEFVLPVARIVEKDYEIQHYTEIKNPNKYEKIILCGTPLKDHQALKGEFFNWMDEYEGKILGICAGMQVLCLQYGAELIDNVEIGMIKVSVKIDNLLYHKDFEAYTLHTFAIHPSKNFEVLFESEKCVQGVKLMGTDFYGVLFHPEVRNKQILENFLKI